MRTRAFTIVELAIALGCLALAALLAAPGLLETRRRSRVAQAIGALKVIASAQQLHRDGWRGGEARGVFADLDGLRRAGLLDDALGSGTSCGYDFEVAVSTTAPALRWRATAHPLDARHPPLAINHLGLVHRGLPGQRLRLPADSCALPGAVSW